jgi:hypothetical protein
MMHIDNGLFIHHWAREVKHALNLSSAGSKCVGKLLIYQNVNILIR